MAQSLIQMGISPNVMRQQNDEEFYNELWEQGNDCDRVGAEAIYDQSHIYYDYYFNDSRRYDNPEGWNPNDPYFLGPENYPDGFCPTIPEETLASDYYDETDYEEYQMQQEYLEYISAEDRISDNWRYISERLLSKIEGEAWRDANT